MLPIWNPPECLGDLFGNNIATYLCMTEGPQSALAMLEMSVVHQAYPSKDQAIKAAVEFAKRIAGFPKLAIRQTLCLMNPAVERYAASFGCTFNPVLCDPA